MTRLIVYAGPIGYYIVRGGPYDLPDRMLPSLEFEIPILVQDRSFNADGSLFYPDSRRFFDAFDGPDIGSGDSDVSPIWNPVFFGNSMVVNGRTWPGFKVEPRRYRFRFFNGCIARFLVLKMVTDNPAGPWPIAAALPFWRIGADGGFLPRAVEQSEMLISPAERADVIVEFSRFAGASIFLINEGPVEPFGGFERSFEPADPAERYLDLPAPPAHARIANTRKLSLGEINSRTTDADPIGALLGQLASDNANAPRFWGDPLTENPALNSTEIWEIHNYTEDAHPIHLHQLAYYVVNRQPFDPWTGTIMGPTRPAGPWERGRKDTVTAYPGEITRIKARFDVSGCYVWHCHIWSTRTMR